MDITTVIGFLLLVALVIAGVRTGQLPAFFFNVHGLGIVLGGSLSALIFNTPLKELKLALRAGASIWGPDLFADEDAVIEPAVALAEQVRKRGAAAWRDIDSGVAGGLLAQAAAAAAMHNDPKIVEDILAGDANRAFDLANEAGNVYRTLAILAPMFGLLGTLVGIVSVLRQISNPEAVGPAMAVALTTAFYGISLANAVCIPVAGRIRARALHEHRARAIICESVVSALRGEPPVSLRSRLETVR